MADKFIYIQNNDTQNYRKTKMHHFCVTFEKDDSCDVMYISEKKKGRGGRKSLQKRWEIMTSSIDYNY